jgi:hypothetical protein
MKPGSLSGRAKNVCNNPFPFRHHSFFNPQKIMTLTRALQIVYGLAPCDSEQAAHVLSLAEQYPEEFQTGQAQRGLSSLSSFLSSHE